MSRLPTHAAIALLGLGAAGCATAPQHQLHAGNNTSVYSMHQPVVERTDFVLDLRTSGGQVPQSEIQRLHAWFGSIGLRYGDRLSIDEPHGLAAAGARQDVARAVAEYGMLLSDGAPMTSGAVSPGTVRVIASRATAHVPGCPLWSDPGIVMTNATSTNYGCGVNSNIAAMVANPNDLVLGQEGSVNSSAATATRAIRTYREAQPTGRQGLPQTSTRENRQ